MRASVLVLSSEPVGEQMAGPAIRAAELARALAGEHDVTLAAPGPSRTPDERVRLVEAGFEDYDALVRAAREHEVVVAQELPPTLLARLARLPARLVLDLYNPIVVEVLEAVAARPPRAQRRIQNLIAARALAQCAVADLVLCASERQRDLWLGGMALNGLIELEAYRRDPGLRSLVDVVPFGIPGGPPPSRSGVVRAAFPAIEEGEPVLLWAGGIWGWLDAATPIRAMKLPTMLTSSSWASAGPGLPTPARHSLLAAPSSWRRQRGSPDGECTSTRAGCPTRSAARGWPRPIWACPRISTTWRRDSRSARASSTTCGPVSRS